MLCCCRRRERRHLHRLTRRGVHIRARFQQCFDYLPLAEKRREAEWRKTVNRIRIRDRRILRDEIEYSFGLPIRYRLEHVKLNSGLQQSVDYLLFSVVRRFHDHGDAVLILGSCQRGIGVQHCFYFRNIAVRRSIEKFLTHCVASSLDYPKR